MASPTRSQHLSPEETAERADRILEAAGRLLVSWGHRKVTIEDVARRAGVGKGTVYLHFPTKEVLFLVVIMRAQVDLGRALLADMAVRPEAILPHSLARSLLLEMERSPILHALFTRDTEVLGTVVDTAADDHTSLLRERTKSMESYFPPAVRRGPGTSRSVSTGTAPRLRIDHHRFSLPSLASRTTGPEGARPTTTEPTTGRQRPANPGGAPLGTGTAQCLAEDHRTDRPSRRPCPRRTEPLPHHPTRLTQEGP